MKRRIIALVTLSILALTSLAGCGSKNAESSTNTPVATEGENQEETNQTSNPGADAKVIKLASTKPTESFAYEGLEKFKSLVEERSNGSLIIELYPASQLGGQNETLEGMGMGTIEMCYVAAGAAEGFYPKSGLMGTLFTARDEDHAVKIWRSEMGQEIVEEMASQIGVRFLDFSIEGVRNVWSKTPVAGLEDLKGLKMRVPEVPMFINTFQALGVNPTPMATSEVYTGLQTNIVDGLEYDVTGVIDQNFVDHCKYCYETKHGVSILAFGVAENFWNNLTEEQREIIRTAAEEISAELNETYYEKAKADRETLEEQGITFVAPTEAESEEIKELMEPIILDYIKDYATKEDLDALKAIP